MNWHLVVACSQSPVWTSVLSTQRVQPRTSLPIVARFDMPMIRKYPTILLDDASSNLSEALSIDEVDAVPMRNFTRRSFPRHTVGMTTDK
jgi:hypothetical protein